MENNANKYITVSYELYVDNDGKEVMMEKAPVEHPFQFPIYFGHGHHTGEF